MGSNLQWLFDRFTEWQDKNFMVWYGHEFTYSWLLKRVSHWKKMLLKNDVEKGKVVALEADFNPDSVSALLALIDLGAIIVPLTESVRSKHEEFMSIAEVRTQISFRPYIYTLASTGVTSEPIFFERDVEITNELLKGIVDSGNPGLVLFSSGSTGKNKAALHDFVPLLDKFRKIRPAAIAMTFLLFDHIGGVNTLLYVLSSGSTAVVCQDRNPEKICQLVEGHKVELLPTTPTFLNLLLVSEAYRRYDLTSLRKITYGTEVMPANTLKQIRKLFPKVTLQQTYGLSELGILRSKSESSDSLWVKLGGEGFELKVKNGTLWIKAKSAMLGYLNAPSPFDEEGWLDTGDAVEVKGEYFRLSGRKSEMINVGGEKVYPTEVENVLLEMPNVKDVSVFGEPNFLTGQMVTASFLLKSTESLRILKQRMRKHCQGKLQQFKVPAKVAIVESDMHTMRFKKMRRKP